MNTALQKLRAALDRPAFRGCSALTVALACWTGPTRLSHFLVSIGILAAALIVNRQGFSAWRSRIGLAAAAVYLLPLLLLPLGTAPGVSGREMIKLAPILAAAVAIPALFPSARSIAAAMSWSACAITIYLGMDLVRLAIQLGPALPVEARFARPYVMNHPNVASMMAAAAFFVLAARALSWRRKPIGFALAAFGAALNLAYLVALASRGTQVAFAFAFASVGFVLPGRRMKLVWALVMATALSLCSSRMEQINRRFAEGDVFSLNERCIVWKHTWSLAKAHPLAGYGYGKQVFQKVYYASDPPEASYEFPHPHNYWLKALFESGWPGVAAHAFLWVTVFGALLRAILAEQRVEGRLWPGTVFLLAVLLTVYGMGDFPDNLARVLQIWLPGMALAVTAGPVGEGARRLNSPT
jgi:O-antigen ligase